VTQTCLDAATEKAAEGGEPCRECSKVATWRVDFRWTCTCWPATMLYCEEHVRAYDNLPSYGYCEVCQSDDVIYTVRRKGSR
jgi:hypothetical protein